MKEVYASLLVNGHGDCGGAYVWENGNVFVYAIESWSQHPTVQALLASVAAGVPYATWRETVERHAAPLGPGDIVCAPVRVLRTQHGHPDALFTTMVTVPGPALR